MSKLKQIIYSTFAVTLTIITLPANALTQAQLVVWTNEAIITAYTYDYKTIIPSQKATAKYFTAKAWFNYSQALLKSGLLDAVKKNKYTVSAVPTMPPQIKPLKPVKGERTWQAEMPILAVYKNPQYQQKQYLNVKLVIQATGTNGGTRGLAITNFQATKRPAPKCEPAAKPAMKSTDTAVDNKEPKKN